MVASLLASAGGGSENRQLVPSLLASAGGGRDNSHLVASLLASAGGGSENRQLVASLLASAGGGSENSQLVASLLASTTCPLNPSGQMNPSYAASSTSASLANLLVGLATQQQLQVSITDDQMKTTDQQLKNVQTLLALQAAAVSSSSPMGGVQQLSQLLGAGQVDGGQLLQLLAANQAEGGPISQLLAAGQVNGGQLSQLLAASLALPRLETDCETHEKNINGVLVTTAP